MPNMAAITVKKNDGTTDIVWSNVQPSAGDKTPAIWRSQTVGAAPAFQPEFRLWSRSNADNTIRRVEGWVDYKQTAVGSDSVTRVINRALFKIEGSVPQSMATADLNEAVSQACNLFASTLTKDSLKQGFAPQ